MIILEWVFVKEQKKYAQNKLFTLVQEFLKKYWSHTPNLNLTNGIPNVVLYQQKLVNLHTRNRIII